MITTHAACQKWYTVTTHNKKKKTPNGGVFTSNANCSVDTIETLPYSERERNAMCIIHSQTPYLNTSLTSPTKRPLLLDLYCSAGGSAMGYYQAGFNVVGVDIVPQPHYPFEFYQDDALYVLGTLVTGGCWNGYTLKQFSAIHASPECKSYTNCNLSPKENYPRQIDPVRRLLLKTGIPYIIENVVGAKRELRASLLLCGSMFGLPMQRHRLFEFGGTDAWIRPPKPCNDCKASVAVSGHSVWDSSLEGTRRKDGKRRPDSVSIEVGRAAMQIPWMNITELAEAIPPAYTACIGSQLLAAIDWECVPVKREEARA